MTPDQWFAAGTLLFIVLAWLAMGLAGCLIHRHLWTEFFGYDWTTEDRRQMPADILVGPINLFTVLLVDGLYAWDKVNAGKPKRPVRVLKRGRSS